MSNEPAGPATTISDDAGMHERMLNLVLSYAVDCVRGTAQGERILGQFAAGGSRLLAIWTLHREMPARLVIGVETPGGSISPVFEVTAIEDSAGGEGTNAG